MSRAVEIAKALFAWASRAAERILPPIGLWFLLAPLNEVVGARRARQSQFDVPAASLPVAGTAKRPNAWKRWRYFSRNQTHWWLLGWTDRLSDAKWQKRLQIDGLSRLKAELAVRPVIICSMHTTSVVLMAAWLRSVGVAAANVPMDLTWFSSPARMRKVELAETMGAPFVIRPDAPNDMIKFLTSGHALVLTSDFTAGRTTPVSWDSGSTVVSTGLFRLARRTGAAIVPMIIFNTGRWRYQATVFEAVSPELVADAHPAAGAAYIVNCLMPLAVARPEQAMGVMIETISQPLNPA